MIDAPPPKENTGSGAALRSPLYSFRIEGDKFVVTNGIERIEAPLLTLLVERLVSKINGDRP